MQPATPEPINRLHAFGVGHGWPTLERAHSSFLYECGEDRLLIDCGEPLSTTYKALGLSYDFFDRLLLTHFHGDHIGGFFMFMQGLWLEKRTRDLTIHLPEDGIKPLQEMLKVACLFPDLFGFKLVFEPLKAGHAIQSGDARITPFDTSHLHSLRDSFQEKYPLRFEAFSFLIERDGRRIVHSGDLGAISDLEPMMDRPVDFLLCELAHFPLEDAIAFLKEKEVRKIAFVHLPTKLWQGRDDLLQRLRKALPDSEISIPDDRSLLSL